MHRHMHTENWENKFATGDKWSVNMNNAVRTQKINKKRKMGKGYQ